MRITNWVVIFLLIFFPISLAMDINQHGGHNQHIYIKKYSRAIKVASEDAAYALLKSSPNSQQDDFSCEGYLKSFKAANLNLDYALKTFYNTLYINFGVFGNKSMEDALKAYLPFQIVAGYEGDYVHTTCNVLNSDDNKKENADIWMPECPYSYFDSNENIIINFTLDDEVTIYKVKEGIWAKSTQAEMKALYPDDNIFSSVDNFESIRRSTIINQLRKHLEYYAAKNNIFMKSQNKSYTFNIPYIKERQMYNTINDICFIGFLQGLSINGVGTDYNTFGFGVTRLSLKNKVYGNIINGIKYYHREDCSYLDENKASAIFPSTKDAAKAGYYPCRKCNP